MGRLERVLEESYLNERLDHLGIVAGVCQEIGLASWLDAQEPENRKPGECGNDHRGDGAQWVRVEPPAVVSAGFHGILNTFCATRMQQVNRVSHHYNARASRPRIRVNIPCG